MAFGTQVELSQTRLCLRGSNWIPQQRRAMPSNANQSKAMQREKAMQNIAKQRQAMQSKESCRPCSAAQDAANAQALGGGHTLGDQALKGPRL